MAKATGNKKSTTGTTGTTGKLKAAASKVAKAMAGTTATAADTAAPVKPAPRPRIKAAPSPTGMSEIVMKVTHDDIARKAYELWMAKGCPQGRDEENWREAEALLASGSRR